MVAAGGLAARNPSHPRVPRRHVDSSSDRLSALHRACTSLHLHFVLGLDNLRFEQRRPLNGSAPHTASRCIAKLQILFGWD